VSTQPWHDELIALELLGDDVAGAEDSRQVSARMRQALDQAVPDRIGRVEEDDGDAIPRSCGRRLGGANRCVLECDDEVHARTDEHPGLRVRGLRFQVPPDQLDVSALDPAQLLEACLQRVQGRRNVIGPDVHQAYALDGLRV
jgi:hypothetical protein